MFKFYAPSKYSPFDAIHLLRHFVPLLKTVFELIDFNVFQCFCCFFDSPLPHQQNVSLCRLFSSWETKTSCSGQDQVNRRVGHWSQAGFGQQLLNTPLPCGQVHSKSPIVKWANALKVFKTKFTEAKCSLSQQRQLVH